jgi:hypothetical protein
MSRLGYKSTTDQLSLPFNVNSMFLALKTLGKLLKTKFIAREKVDYTS